MALCLPNEIIQEIILTLYETYSESFDVIYNSCMLLNKTWCINTMAVMWRKVLDDYGGSNFNKGKIIDAYIAGLSQDSKNLIGISEKVATTYYNYASFLREIELINFYEVLLKYVTFLIYNDYEVPLKEQDFYTIQILYHELLKLFIKESKSLSYRIIFDEEYSSCFKLFKSFPFYNNLSKIIPSNSHLASFQYFDMVDREALLEFSKIFSSVGDFQFELYHEEDIAGLITFIESINAIKEIQLHIQSFKKLEILFKLFTILFKNCEKLKYLAMYLEDLPQYDDYLKLFIEHLVLENLEKFLFNGILNERHLRHLDMLFQNAKGNIKTLFLQNFYLKEDEKKFLIFESIYNHCPRLTNLYIWVDSETIEYVFKIFKACRNLQRLALFDHEEESFNIDDWMLRFPSNSPPSLKFLKLGKNLKFNTVITLNEFFQKCHDNSMKNMYFFVMKSKLNDVKELIEKYIELGTLNWKSRRCYIGDEEFLSQNKHFYRVDFTA